jgi:hypothetical protein
MTVLWLDPLSILLLYVNLVELVQIYSVLMLWILSASISGFFVLCCIIKLTLGSVNFPTVYRKFQKPPMVLEMDFRTICSIWLCNSYCTFATDASY